MYLFNRFIRREFDNINKKLDSQTNLILSLNERICSISQRINQLKIMLKDIDTNTVSPPHIRRDENGCIQVVIDVDQEFNNV